MTTPQLCADCKAPIVKPADSGGTGYAVLPDGAQICYPCADSRQRIELLDRSRPFVAYVSGDGTKITSWTGGHLMRVTTSHAIRLTFAHQCSL